MLVPFHRNHCGSIPESLGGAAAGEEVELLALRAVGFYPESCQKMEG